MPGEEKESLLSFLECGIEASERLPRNGISTSGAPGIAEGTPSSSTRMSRDQKMYQCTFSPANRELLFAALN